jgi:hypothetical protein
MSRSTRAVVGGVVAFVLVLVAAVSGAVVLVGTAQLRGDGGSLSGFEPVPGGSPFVDPVTVQAEVLDIDGEGGEDTGDVYGWASVDVAFETPDGTTEVAYVDLGPQTDDSPPVPEVGDTIEVVHERGEPSFVLRADDPQLTGEPGDVAPDAVSLEDQRGAAEQLVRRSGVLALSALVLAVVVGLLTLVAVRRAPVDRPVEPDTVAVG